MRIGMSQYYSQCGEDRWLLENFPELATRNGVFVEVGAYDGIESSNTLALEQLGWTGMCFEPSPESYELLAQNRPNHSPLAIGPNDGFAVFHNGGGRGSHGIIPNFHNEKNRIIIIVKRLENAVAFDRIDLLSIDTEGTELEVWASRGRYHPEFVICEFDTYGAVNPNVIPQFESDGYKLIHTTLYNHIFKAK
jgi:FkbM family methyltransferase